MSVTLNELFFNGDEVAPAGGPLLNPARNAIHFVTEIQTNQS
jgi:hypothetical protein